MTTLAASQQPPRSVLHRMIACGHRPDDSTEQKRQKSLFTFIILLKAAVCAGWYIPFWLLGAYAAGAAPFIYQLVTIVSILVFARTKNLESFHRRQLLLILLLPVGFHAGMGSFAASGGVLLWAFLAPLGALLFQGPRSSLRWLVAFIVIIALAAVNEVFGLLPVHPLPPLVLTIFFALNIGSVMAITYAGVRYFAFLLEQEKANQVELNAKLRQERAEQQRLNSVLAAEKAEQQRLNGALQAANEHKSRFLAGMSHELRTPMNAVIGFTRVVKRKGADVLPQKQIENLDRILASANHLLNLINDVLDLSKIEAGRMDVEAQTFIPQSIVREAVQTARPMVRSAVSVVEEIDDGVPPLSSDPNRVRQIVLNLISNAAKFTHEGEIRVCLRAAGAEHIEIAVADTGIGIAEDAQQRVFEEFQQADNSTTRQYGGTGLGLSISRRLARMLGGDIALESEVGKGSTFTLRLPMKSTVCAAREVRPEAKAMRCGDRPLVLVVDDDRDARDLLTESLGRMGYQVVGAQSGEEGIARAKALKPCAIVLDIMMPDKDGWQVLHDLKHDQATKEIPVVVSSVVDDSKLANELGAAYVLPKPPSEEAMRQVFEDLRATPAVVEARTR